jgi:hypothetical protein
MLMPPRCGERGTPQNDVNEHERDQGEDTTP